ncbi:hypothetical protein [uncultured Shimia sp.]|uniref:hypothetical protein n=1 Tax=uncultured Shimia sp. TaxID=573152 RepID=UPI0026289520|nr:hypothetical protein [uncultured Shimia sp.]
MRAALHLVLTCLIVLMALLSGLTSNALAMSDICKTSHCAEHVSHAVSPASVGAMSHSGGNDVPERQSSATESCDLMLCSLLALAPEDSLRLQPGYTAMNCGIEPPLSPRARPDTPERPPNKQT